MKWLYIFAAVVVAYVAVIVIVNKMKYPAAARSQPVEAKNDMYTGLRDIALHMQASEIGLHLPDHETHVYGVVIDRAMGNTIVTLACFQTGDASSYVSTGGGSIGGIDNPAIKEASIKLVNSAQNYLDKTHEDSPTTLPPANSIKFYLLTNKGRYVADESEQNLQAMSSPWMNLFEQASLILSEINKSESKR